MKKLLYSNLYTNLFTGLILIAISIFLFLRLKFSIIVNDDMLDLITNNWELSHGRFIMEPIGVFFARTLPLLLNKNIQDFAIISQGILKILGFVYLLYILSSNFYKSNVKNIAFCLVISFSFFFIFSILIANDYVWCFDTYQVFFGYTAASIFFFLFWQKIYDFYIDNKDINKSDFIYIFLLSCLVAFSNELFSIVSILILILVLFDCGIKGYINNSEKRIRFFLFSFISILLMTLCSLLSKGSIVLWDVYDLKIDFSFLSSELLPFSKIFFKYIILNNIYFIIPILFCLLFLYIKYQNYNRTSYLLKYSLYTIVSFFIFLFGTIILPKTCIYTNLENKYWLLHPGLLTDFSIVLIAIFFLLLGYILSIEKNSKMKIIILILSIFISSSLIIQNFSLEKIKFIHSYKNIKESMYINDKISLFYLKQGKTVVIPKEQFFYIIPDIHPDELMSNKQIYKQIYDKERARYLIYLERNYKVNVSSGITFLPYNDAMEKYKKLGGNFSEEELEKIKFSKLNDL